MCGGIAGANHSAIRYWAGVDSDSAIGVLGRIHGRKMVRAVYPTGSKVAGRTHKAGSNGAEAQRDGGREEIHTPVD